MSSWLVDVDAMISISIGWFCSEWWWFEFRLSAFSVDWRVFAESGNKRLFAHRIILDLVWLANISIIYGQALLLFPSPAIHWNMFVCDQPASTHHSLKQSNKNSTLFMTQKETKKTRRQLTAMYLCTTLRLFVSSFENFWCGPWASKCQKCLPILSHLTIESVKGLDASSTNFI